MIFEKKQDILYSRDGKKNGTYKKIYVGRTLIPRIKGWVICKHDVTDYHLIQALSGHRCFGKYLAKRGHRLNSYCLQCGEEEDNAKHTLFVCLANEPERRTLAAEVEMLIKDILIATMLTLQDKWDRLAAYIRKIIKTKETKERKMRKRD